MRQTDSYSESTAKLISEKNDCRMVSREEWSGDLGH